MSLASYGCAPNTFYDDNIILQCQTFLGEWEERKRDLGKDRQTQAERKHTCAVAGTVQGTPKSYIRLELRTQGSLREKQIWKSKKPGHQDLLFHYGVSVDFQDIHLKWKQTNRRPGSMHYIHWVEPASTGKPLVCSPAVPLQV